MVTGYITLFFLAVFKQREVRHPQEVPAVFRDETELLGQFYAQIPQSGIDHTGFARLEEYDVAGFNPGFPGERGAFFFRKEFGNGRLPLVLMNFDPCQTLRAVNFDEFRQIVNFLTAHAAALRYARPWTRGAEQKV